MNEQDIKDRLQNYSLDVAPALKESTFERYRRARAVRSRRLGMAGGAFVLTALALLFALNNHSSLSPVEMTEDNAPLLAVVDKTDADNVNVKDKLPEKDNTLIAGDSEKKRESEQTVEKELKKGEEQWNAVEKELEENEGKELELEVEESEGKERWRGNESTKGDEWRDDEIVGMRDSEGKWEMGDKKERRERIGSKVSIKLLGSASGKQNINELYAAAGTMGAGAQGYGWADNPRLGIALYNKGEQTREERQHFSPMRIGLAFNYEFYPRWSIESGISYKELRSEFREGSQEHYIKSYQRLQYIGLPLKLGFQAISIGDFSAYLNAGAVLEKCMAINHRDLYYIGGTEKASESQRETNGPFQFSLEAGAGMDYKINNWLSIFAEISAGWYFDDGSSLKTIYKDSPLNLGFNLGLRFGL